MRRRARPQDEDVKRVCVEACLAGSATSKKMCGGGERARSGIIGAEVRELTGENII